MARLAGIQQAPTAKGPTASLTSAWVAADDDLGRAVVGSPSSGAGSGERSRKRKPEAGS
jgi:hypothetical protein